MTVTQLRHVLYLKAAMIPALVFVAIHLSALHSQIKETQ